MYIERDPAYPFFISNGDHHVTRQEAHDEGYKARYNGKPLKSRPATLTKTEERYWLIGWNEANTDALLIAMNGASERTRAKWNSFKNKV